MKEKETQLYKFGRGGACFYIPMDIFKDSAFPFQINEKVRMRIDGRKVIIEKIREEEREQVQ
ncbi:MAG: hypothetical protein QXF56_02400 [Candidatus Micrarchaeia archaeon]